MDQEDLLQLQSKWQAETQEPGDVCKKHGNAQPSREQHKMKKAILEKFAFVEERQRGTGTSAALPWGHSKRGTHDSPQQVGSKQPARSLNID